MASELGDYLAQRVQTESQGVQHPTSLRIDGDGDTVLVEGRKAALQSGSGTNNSVERQRIARNHYEEAHAMLQEGKSAAEALERLNRAIEYDPTYGDAYVLKSYIHLEAVPNLDEALASGQLAVQHASTDPDSFYMLGLVQEKRGKFVEAETALLQALKVNGGYQDVYFSLGALYADHLKDRPKSIQAFRRYLELGGAHARARSVVTEADQAAKQTP
jgi:tetratricopeptide (TPR) repeat protein